jgi:AcrR family transcriptional regulator
VATAREIARRDGMQAVTMSGVARALDVTPMALYRYIGDADHLIDAVLDAIDDEIALPEPASGEKGLAQFATILRTVLTHYANYPGLAEVLLARGTLATPASVRIVEWFLRYFQTGERNHHHAAVAFETFREFFLVNLIQRRPPKLRCRHNDAAESDENILDAIEYVTAEDRFNFAVRLFLQWAQERDGGQRL